MTERVQAILRAHERKREELIPILQEVQAVLGYLPNDAMLDVARHTGVAESNVFAVASFYAQFRFTPRGRKIVRVCRGTACHVRGAERILREVEKQLGIREGETTPDLEYSLETVACIGCCGLSPCLMINDEVKAKLTPKKVAELFGKGDRP